MRHLLIVLFVSAFSICVFAQNDADAILQERGELFFKFKVKEQDLGLYSRIVSIDSYRNGYCYAYANEHEFQNFRKTNTEFSLVEDYYTVDRDDNMATTIQEMQSWNRYPTYPVYVAMMQKYASDYPEICKLDTIGHSVIGRMLLALKISDNPNQDEQKPEVLFVGQMHGDEMLTGISALKLIDTLVTNYGSNAQIRDLVNSLEIYVIPIANPDGAYFFGDNDMMQSRRANLLNVDINRNFPDFVDGSHPDGNAYQVETQALMDFADAHNFVMGANLHSGSELINYPFDTESTLPADDDWWKMTSAEYVSSVRSKSSGTNYFSDYADGYTNGYAWYRITGGHQDYMNYYHHCKEFTIEMALNKKLPAAQLPRYLNYNESAMIGFLIRATLGLRGLVTDSLTGEPVNAKVYVAGHDKMNSHSVSSGETGEYYKHMYTGDYDVTFSAVGYVPKTISVHLDNRTQTIQDVQLVEGYNGIEESEHSSAIFPNPVSDILYFSPDYTMESYEIYDSNGRVVISGQSMEGAIDVSILPRGLYLVRVISKEGLIVQKFIKQ